MNLQTLNASFSLLSNEARELYIDKDVPVLDNPPSPLEFHRHWICQNKPVLIRKAIDHWPALSLWSSNTYLRSRTGSQEVTVAVTPNGYADAIFNNKFVMPEERMMSFGDFLNVMESPLEKNGIFYVQKQNSNFTDEFCGLMNDAESHISWATEAFGKDPDAINFWIGDKRAVTSMHKDHYENIYCVVRGKKTFTLHPPTDQPFIPYEMRAKPVDQLMQAEGYISKLNDLFHVDELPMCQVPWIAVDPLNPDYEKYPQYQQAQSITVTVNAGETLYLPSLWFHHVQQSHNCIAVNFWYDMEYDIKYNYYKFVESLLHTEQPPKSAFS